MDLKSYRQSRGLTQQQVAEALDVSGKSYVSQLESGGLAWPIRVALRAEAWSGGALRAVDLVPEKDAALLQTVMAEGAP